MPAAVEPPCQWNPEGSHQERQALVQASPEASEDLARMAHRESAKTFMPARVVFQAPVVGRLLFLFPSGKEGSVRP